MAKAVLVIHGFAGGIYDIEVLANRLEYNPNLDVFVFTLPGHEHIFNNKVTKEEWLKAADDQIKDIINHGYNEIYLIGHSMGGLIASFLAVKYKEVKRLVLAAAAFEYLQFNNGEVNVVDSLKITPNIIKQYSPNNVISRILSQPLSTYKEFMDLSAMLQEIPKQITIPTLVIHGSKDEIVPPSSSQRIYKEINNKNKELVIVNDATHDLFHDEKKEEAIKCVEQYLKKIIISI